MKSYYEDITDLRREVNGLYNFFSERVGDVVDMNLDYFPEQIVVTFVRHQDVQRALSRYSDDVFAFRFRGSTLFHPMGAKEFRDWTFEPSKVDFECQVRNCTLADDLPPNKYLPIFVQREKFMSIASYF